ncbi:MAG: hypothetical protein DBY17_08365 [Oscillospiraceae bacterium]|nr:MAG: hypothetical protein DBY17_08365 [Oscillospiraceae bacterium]
MRQAAFYYQGRGMARQNTRCRPAYRCAGAGREPAHVQKAHGGHGMQVYGFMPARGRYSKPLCFGHPGRMRPSRAARPPGGRIYGKDGFVWN